MFPKMSLPLCVFLHIIPLGTCTDRFCTISLLLLSAINKLHVFNKLMSDWPGATGRCVLSDISWQRALVTGRVGRVGGRERSRERQRDWLYLGILARWRAGLFGRTFPSGIHLCFPGMGQAALVSEKSQMWESWHMSS